MIMRRTSWRFGVLALAVGLWFAAGCGSEPATTPKLELSEQEKQQLKQLDEQRQKEWGGARTGP